MATALNYPRNFGVKASLAQEFAGFTGTAREFRDFFDYKEKVEGGHKYYTPEDIRKFRMYVQNIDPSKPPKTKEMPQIIPVHTSKGGVGKTTLSVNLAVAFALHGHKTLFIDSDPQGSASDLLGVDTAREDIYHIGNLIRDHQTGKDPIDFNKAICPIYEGQMLDLIPADITLTDFISSIDVDAVDPAALSELFQKNIDFFSQYEVIVLDTAPGTSPLTNMVLTAAEKEIITPITTDGQSIKALRVLFNLLISLNERSIRKQHLQPLIVANAYRMSDYATEGLKKLSREFRKFLYPKAIPFSPVFHHQFSHAESPPPDAMPGVERQPNTVASRALFDFARYLILRYKIKLNGHENSLEI